MDRSGPHRSDSHNDLLFKAKMGSGEESVLGELRTNMEVMHMRNGKGDPRKGARTATSDDDVLPPSGRFSRIDVTTDWDVDATDRDKPVASRKMSGSTSGNSVSIEGCLRLITYIFR